jgi:hypothetical protein
VSAAGSACLCLAWPGLGWADQPGWLALLALRWAALLHRVFGRGGDQGVGRWGGKCSSVSRLPGCSISSAAEQPARLPRPCPAPRRAAPRRSCPCRLDGFSGELCDKEAAQQCINQCNGHGTCNLGFCKCDKVGAAQSAQLLVLLLQTRQAAIGSPGSAAARISGVGGVAAGVTGRLQRRRSRSALPLPWVKPDQGGPPRTCSWRARRAGTGLTAPWLPRACRTSPSSRRPTSPPCWSTRCQHGSTAPPAQSAGARSSMCMT